MGLSSSVTYDPINVKCGDCGANDWCEHLIEFIQSGRDAELLDFGIEFDVPVSPSAGIIAHVIIGGSPINDTCSHIYLLGDNLFGPGQTSIPLGLWTKGEGMYSIRAVILDWIKAASCVVNLLDPGICPSPSHNNFRHNYDRGDPTLNLKNNWYIACYGLCLPQFIEVSGLKTDLVPNAGKGFQNP